MRKSATQDEPVKVWISDNGMVRVKSAYNASFVHEIKQMPRGKRHWDGDRKVWDFEYELLDEVVALCKKFYKEVIVVGNEVKSDVPEPWTKLFYMLNDQDMASIHRVLAKRYHPDMGGKDGEMAKINELFKELRGINGK